ncbi:MAG: BON domain-containing protein [Capsulimonadaceae bacterium]|nr:BON domain-containing protein [Capsulimonadaceae bacterium]
MKPMTILLLAGVAAIGMAGCSAHTEYAKTPVLVGTTPTYRSTVLSTDPRVEPFYTQPGVNSGPPVSLPLIPSQDRWDPNDPVATSVYNALTTSSDVHLSFLRVSAHKGTIRLQGLVANGTARKRAEAIAKSEPGVRAVQDEVTISKRP